uniref:Uncharacterized protein n=1 Tax=Anguilla anguilla TaxID=7936 RepID=A0A0E9QGB4_ANGAN
MNTRHTNLHCKISIMNTRQHTSVICYCWFILFAF